jgi:hypothetical protein
VKFSERLRRLDDRVLDPAPPGPAWPRLIGAAAWLTTVGVRSLFDGVADSSGGAVAVGVVVTAAAVVWLALSTRVSFRRRVPGFPPVVAALLWIAAGGIPLVFDHEGRPPAFVAVNALLVLVGAGIGIVALRRRSRGGSPVSA